MQETDAPIVLDKGSEDPAPRVSPRLGIIGGGQLAKMTAMAGIRLGCEVVVLEREGQCPAASLASQMLIGDWNSVEALTDLAARVDLVTLENEFIDAESLEALEATGALLLPAARTLRLIQDKLKQKQVLAEAGLPVPRFRDAPDKEAVRAAGDAFGWPLLLKARRNAYDGKGNATVNGPQELDAAWEALTRGREKDALYVEEFVPFERELAMMITRGRDNATVAYPLVESIQRDHVCHIVKAPAEVPEAVAAEATGIASRAAELVGCVGSMGVEMFLGGDGRVLINELAPRVHNSGHYTIEACDCSQFENHVRAVLGWPLGSTAMVAPAAVMINLLGRVTAPAIAPGLARALAVPGAHVHVYGKAMTRPGRKMGHVTALGATPEAALKTARAAADLIRFGETQ